MGIKLNIGCGWRNFGDNWDHIDGGNYLLIWPTHGSSTTEKSLREAGILVRDMAGKPLLDGALRVSIGTTNQMQQFWEAFTSIDFI